jgi:hypothetical protein
MGIGKETRASIQQLLSQLLEISSVMKQTNEQVNNLSQQQQTLLDEQLLILRILTNKA